MNDNVIILGAGFSFDAGIPLLGNFIERMWEYSIRKTANGKALTTDQVNILKEALAVRTELDGYHGRVVFDDRNIEDILSMLAFNILGGGRTDTNKFKAFIKSISETIEIACNVKHPGYPTDNKFNACSDGDEVYRHFWKGLIKWFGKSGSIPTIITFNYDLVLERSLFQVLINMYYDSYDNRVPFDGFSLNYFYKYFVPEYYKINYVNYNFSNQKTGTIIKKVDSALTGMVAEIEILKLHGSLNFPLSSMSDGDSSPGLTARIENPYILPPVSNKQSNGPGNESWKVALNRLREAKNVVFVGYSLPKTDMYMQFFLKAALGPNQNLNKINVFDPILWRDNEQSRLMIDRYESCFSEQIRPRIDFKPGALLEKSKLTMGTTKHFVNVLSNAPETIFF